MKDNNNSTGRFTRFFRSLANKARRRSKSQPYLHRFWSKAFEADADTFCGLYTPLLRVANGRSRKPERVLAEWRDRTVLNLSGTEDCDLAVSDLSRLIESNNPDETAECARRILASALDAGITHDKNGEAITLDDLTVSAYLTDEGDPLYVGDRVKIDSPAWYQNAKVIESGVCELN